VATYAIPGTAEDEERGKRMKEQGFKPVELAKTPCRPKEKSVYPGFDIWRI
jgi:hypothetical protein